MSSTVIAGSTRTPKNRGITKNAGSAGGGEYRNAGMQECRKRWTQGAVENTIVGTSARYPAYWISWFHGRKFPQNPACGCGCGCQNSKNAPDSRPDSKDVGREIGRILMPACGILGHVTPSCISLSSCVRECRFLADSCTCARICRIARMRECENTRV
jgi:hypothetical protein